MKKEKSLINRPNNKNIKSKQDAIINVILYLVGKSRMMIFFALFKKIVALGYLIQQKYRNDIRNMLP